MDSKKFTIHPQIEVNLREQDIEDIMVTALEGGITYWCYQVQMLGEQLGKYASQHLARGGKLKLYDGETGEKYWLDRDMFLTGVKLYLEQGNHVSIDDNVIDPCDIDANDADCIIQFALFGEVQFS